MTASGERMSLLPMALNVLRVALLALLAVAVLRRDDVAALVAITTFALSYLPGVIGRVTDAFVPPLAPVALGSLVVVQLAGETLDLYERHPIPYDIFAHLVETGAAVILVVLAVEAVNGRVPTGRLAVTCLGLGLVLAASWEIVEAIGGALTETTFQHGWDDTLADVGAGVFGSALAALVIAATRRHHDRVS